MKIKIEVFISDYSRYFTGGGNVLTEFWDIDGASETISGDIVNFPKSNFLQPSKPSNGYVVNDVQKKYTWLVSVATFAQREKYKITKFPTVLFTDEKGKEKGRLEGNPYKRGDIAAVLSRIFNTNTAKKGGYVVLSLFLLFLIKKKVLLK